MADYLSLIRLRGDASQITNIWAFFALWNMRYPLRSYALIAVKSTPLLHEDLTL